MSEDTRKQVHIRIPEAAKQAGERDATRRKSNLQDVLAGVICAHYGVPYESRSNRRSPGGGGRPTHRTAA